MLMYLEYVKDGSRMDLLQKVLDYNRDDCLATMVAKDWLAGPESRCLPCRRI